MTKICESLAGGFARVSRTLDRPPQPVKGVLRMQKSREVAELYWRFISGFCPIRSNPGRLGQTMQYMQIVQSRINTGYFASR